MTITKIQVSFGSTVNLGNYSSARFDVQLEAELGDDDEPTLVVAALHEQCREEVRAQALPIVRRNRLRMEEIFAHLPETLQAQILGKET